MKKTYKSPVIQIVQMSPFEFICESGENEVQKGETDDPEVYQDDNGCWRAE